MTKYRTHRVGWETFSGKVGDVEFIDGVTAQDHQDGDRAVAAIAESWRLEPVAEEAPARDTASEIKSSAPAGKGRARVSSDD